MWWRKKETPKAPATVIKGDIPFTVCESTAAIVTHARELGDEPHNFGGGLKTLSLCGTKVSWDTRIPVAYDTITCRVCRQKFKEWADAR